MKGFEIQKYTPSVTIQQMMAFEANDPTTHTPSPFINAFLRIFYATEADEKDIARIMDLPYRDFAGAFRVETGMNFRRFHDYWVALKLNITLATNPGLSSDELAQRLGFGHRSALWQFYNSRRYRQIAKEFNLTLFPKPHKQVHC